MKIALMGNPNSGKTSMYNLLTGENEKVGNWAGVTVEKKEGKMKRGLCHGAEKITVVDLPGAYSMSPFTSEESVTSSYVKEEAPDVLINIVDATNLSRSLFFTTQLLGLGIPMVVALNKSDINEKRGTHIDTKVLAEKLGCPVVNTVSVSAVGIKELVEQAVARVGVIQTAPYIETSDLNDRETAKAADKKRYAFVNAVVEQVETRKVLTNKINMQDKVDAILTNSWVGIPVFAFVMFFVFYISQSTLGTWIADWLVGWIEIFQAWVAEKINGADPFIYSLVVDGIIGGVGAVLGFLPLVMVMYFMIALLEDCGYMARASVVLDPIFKKVGLSGKSVIPMVIGTGCAIPGVMACRTIRSERERRATAMLAPFMPCGAKLPVIALFAGAFFADAKWVGPLMYFAGIIIILIGALIVNQITGNQFKKSYFIMEIPEYKWPSLGSAFMSMCARGKAYIVKAGTIILVCNTVVQIMQAFDWKLNLVAEGAENTSILATIASPIGVLLVPIVGISAWQLAAAAVTGFIAKENVVGTLAVCYALTDFIDTEELALVGGAGEVAMVMGLTKSAALAFLMFNLFSPPCFAAMGAMSSEMKSVKWFWAGIALQLATGYTVAFWVYQIGTFITTGKVGAGFLPGFVAVLIIVIIIVGLIQRTKNRLKAEEARKAA